MTALFKSKVEVRQQLYYGKFKYKLVVKAINLAFAHTASSIHDFHENMDYAKLNRWWRQPTPNVDNENTIQAIIDFRLKYKNDDSVSLRKEGNSITVYTNEVDILNEVHSFMPSAKMHEANLMPTGVKLFSREPPAKYRVYMSGSKISTEEKDELKSYLDRTPDMQPSDSTLRWLNHVYVYPRGTQWTQSNYFIDFDEEANLMMLFILFPGVFGKNFKLEKKE